MPSSAFATLPLSPATLANLDALGYTEMTPIQAQSLPVMLKGMDLIAQAKTGSGKTAAFGIALLEPINPRYFGCQALVLCPTRELADQVAKELRRLARSADNIKILTLCGGVSIGPQIGSLEHGAHVIVGTPGRVQEHLKKGTLKLDGLNKLILDEADRMLDMGFLPDLQRIINLLPKQRQNLMFSATFSPEIKKLANTFLNNPLTIEVARSNATAEKVTQIVYKVDEEQKRDVVEHLIRSRDMKQVIIFSNTKIGASRLSTHLEKRGVKASAIHGDKTQQERMAALDAFKNGSVEVLVATDVAARGLDISDLPAVINYDLPYNAEDYVHRIGRTGRAGASGDALSVYSDKDERLLADIEKLIKQTITRGTLEGFVAPTSRGREGGREGGRDFGAREAGRDSGRDYAARDAERGPRRGDDAGRGAPPRGPRSLGPGARREKVDPWFLKPYEPTSSPRRDDVVPNSVAKPAKQKLAFLLGGGPKPQV